MTVKNSYGTAGLVVESVLLPVFLPAYRPQEGVDHIRIKLPATLPLHFGKRDLDRSRLPVGTLVRHGIERIGCGHDASWEWYLTPGETGRVSPAVPTFVVMGSYGLCRAEKLGGSPAKDIGSQGWYGDASVPSRPDPGPRS